MTPAAQMDYEPPEGYELKRQRGENGVQYWYFYAPDGHRGGAHAQIENTLVAAERHYAKSRITERKCMTCRQPFKSQGKHNRMCPNCRKETTGLI